MKKLITIILALIMTLLTAPQKGADRPPVTAEKPPQTTITTMVEQVPEKSEKPAETAFVGDVSEAETATEGKEDEAPREAGADEKGDALGVFEGIHRLRLRGRTRQAVRSRLRHRTLRATAKEA